MIMAIDLSNDPGGGFGPMIVAILLFTIVGAVISSPLWLLGNYEQRKALKPAFVGKMNRESQIKQSKYQSVVDSQNEEICRYNRAVENWNNLYYCYRDDCVFMPGKGESATVNNIQDYQYSV